MAERPTPSAAADAPIVGGRPGVAGVVAQAVAPMVEHSATHASYVPDAPTRAQVGSGKLIRSQVVSAPTVQPVANARVEYDRNTTPDAGGIGDQNPANLGQMVADGHAPFFYRHLTPSAQSQDDVTIVRMGI